MGNNSLSGMLPANLSFCTSLTTLILHYNRLGGRIPGYIDDALTRLLRLSLMNNTFTVHGANPRLPGQPVIARGDLSQGILNPTHF